MTPYPIIWTTNTIFQSPTLSLFNMWQNVLMQKIKKIHRVDPEKNVSLTVGQIGRTGLIL